jgi:hypothetical protein
MANFLRDTRFGFRLLRKNPGFAAVAIFALALGVGANTAIFSIFYATFLAPFPYPQPDQLVVVWASNGGRTNGVSAGDYLDWKRDSKVFQVLGAVSGEQFNVSAGVERAVQIEGDYLTPGFLDQLIGDKPFMGRYLLPDDAVAGKDHVVIITHKLWETHFGADPNIIGKQIHLNGELYTGADEPRFSLARGLRTHETGCDHRASERGHGYRGAAHRRRLSEIEQGLGRERRAAEERFPESRHKKGIAAAAGRGGFRAADRLRQRGKPAAGARRGATKRGSRASFGRRFATADIHAVPDREPGTGVRRRRARNRLGVGADESDRGFYAAVHIAFGSGCPHERSGAGVHSGDGDVRRRVVRLRPSVASGAHEFE